MCDGPRSTPRRRSIRKMKNTELLDAVASTAGMSIGSGESGTHAPLARILALETASEVVASSILGNIHTERRAARIGRNRRMAGCTRRRPSDPTNS